MNTRFLTQEGDLVLLTELVKHLAGQHNQQSHAGGKGGGSASSGDGMPYKWNPTRPTGSVFSTDPAYAIEFFESVADSPISIRVTSTELDKIIEEGRFKSLNELSPKDYQPDLRYRQSRSELENDKWGVPKDAPQPIYGYLDTEDTDYTELVNNYGDIQVNLKESIASRTTITAGDSLNGKTIPIELSELQGKTTNPLHVAGASTFSTQSKLFYRDSKPTFDYWEAQIHGGVSLKDIKSVDIRSQKGYAPPVSKKTIETLKGIGIEVIQND